MNPSRNEPCPCGSGKKYKHCCEGKQSVAKLAATELNQLGMLVNTGQFAVVETRASALLQQYPDEAGLWKLLAIALQMQGKSGLAAFERAALLLPSDAGAHMNLGNALQGVGRLEEAVQSYQRALAIKPTFAEAHNNLGASFAALGQYEAAIASYRRAVQIKPDFAAAHSGLGGALRHLEQWPEAVVSYRRAIKLQPDLAETHNDLGVTLRDLGQFDQAVTSYRQALRIQPDDAAVLSNLGVVLRDLGRLDEAVTSFRQALAIRPDDAETLSNLGLALHDLGRLEEAVLCYKEALAINPDYAEAYNNLGLSQNLLGRYNEAVASCRQAISLDPNFAEAHNNLGNALNDIGKTEEALQCYQKALEIEPNSAETHNNIGLILSGYSQISDAITCFRRALEINPNYAEAHNHLAGAFQNLGQLNDAITSYQNALNVKPDYFDAHTGLLFCLNYTTQRSPADSLTEALHYGERVAQKVSSRFATWQCDYQTRCLRVGIVSADLRSHPVAYFIESFLAQCNPGKIELIAYTNNPKTDELTARIKPYFSKWREIFALSDKTAAQLIHDDGVHVLIDLSGHTAKNRLPMFAWKPAPVQASWLGYLATTGVAEMDYLLADEVGVPKDRRQQFTESIWYLPDSLFCFTAPKSGLATAPLPALTNGMCTFGCFQSLARVNDDVLAAWGSIFSALPDAKLRMQCKPLSEPVQREQLVQRLQRYGISPSRVTMHGQTNREGYLAAYAEVDIVLDTFPYSGCTTTCEALWMGVPVLTLAGNTLLARQGASVITAAGLEDWVTISVADYVAKAVELSGDLSKLATLRTGLREQVRTAPLFDAPRFAKHFEQALWGMWQAKQERLV